MAENMPLVTVIPRPPPSLMEQELLRRGMRPNIWRLMEPYVSECKEFLAFKLEYCRLMQRTVHEGEAPDAVLSSHVCTLENLAEAHINLHKEKHEAEAQLDYDRFQRESEFRELEQSLRGRPTSSTGRGNASTISEERFTRSPMNKYLMMNCC